MPIMSSECGGLQSLSCLVKTKTVGLKSSIRLNLGPSIRYMVHVLKYPVARVCGRGLWRVVPQQWAGSLQTDPCDLKI